jgi:hypothetical protein
LENKVLGKYYNPKLRMKEAKFHPSILN